MTNCLNFKGELVDVDLSLDRGFLLGDGIFETLRVEDGLVFWLEEHLERLKKHAGDIGVPFPWQENTVRQFIAQAGPSEGLQRCRLSLTAGEGGRGYRRPSEIQSRLIVSLSPAKPTVVPSACLAPDPVPVNWPAKTLSGLPRILRAPPEGQEWIYFSTDGFITEACMANVFWIRQGVLETPALNKALLGGLTRSRILSLSRDLGFEVSEANFTVDTLDTVTAFFLSGTVAGLVPVSQLNGRTLPGDSLIDRLISSYDKLVDGERQRIKALLRT